MMREINDAIIDMSKDIWDMKSRFPNYILEKECNM